MLRPRPKELLVVTVGVAVLVLLGVPTCYGPPRFWRSHHGWTESDVVSSLGEPVYDSRKSPPNYNAPLSEDYRQGDPFTLGWYHGIGVQLSLHFENDEVIAHSRGSK